MEIRVTIETVYPLTGTAATASGEAVRFEGWFRLLDAIAQLVGARSGADDRR